MNDHWPSFHFAQPWLLLLVPATVFLLWRLGARERATGLVISSLALVRTVGRSASHSALGFRDAISWTAIALLLAACAQPLVESGVAPETAKAIDVMLLIDASRSMDTKDFETTNEANAPMISRLDAVRRVVATFVRQRPKDRIGVIAFAEKPYLLCPLTLDHSWMMESLANIQTALGTAMGSSVEAGVDLLRQGGNKSRAMILITDGLNTSGSDPLQAAKTAAAAGVRLYTIAAVSYSQVATAHFEDNPLYVMAKTTGGEFFQAGNSSSLQDIYREIDRLERQQLRQLRSHQFKPVYWVLAGLAAILLAAEGALRAARWLRIP